MYIYIYIYMYTVYDGVICSCYYFLSCCPIIYPPVIPLSKLYIVRSNNYGVQSRDTREIVPLLSYHYCTDTAIAIAMAASRYDGYGVVVGVDPFRSDIGKLSYR